MAFAILLGLAGMVIIVTNGRLDSIRMSNLFGDLLALGAAACWGIFSNLGKRNRIDTALSNYVYVFSAFILSVVSLLIFSKPILPALPAAAGLLWLGMSNIVVAYYLWFRALKTTSAARMASLAFITPFVTLLFIMLLLGEKISWVQVAGLLVILAGLAVQTMFGLKAAKPGAGG
jgi:drug/metabolite transporter (DMT)-like permease